MDKCGFGGLNSLRLRLLHCDQNGTRVHICHETIKIENHKYSGLYIFRFGQCLEHGPLS
jgi:hypothetical protein